MEIIYRLNTRELENSLIDTIKTTYPDQDIEIMVRERDETEYLLRSPANRKQLEESVKNIKQNKIISFDNLVQAIECAEEFASI